MPPSDATSRYPPPLGVGAMPTIGFFGRLAPRDPRNPAPPGVRGGGHAPHGRVQRDRSRGPEEPGIAIVEDPTVGRDEPVASGIDGGSGPNHGLVQRTTAGRAEEPGVTEVEDPTVRRDQPVPASQSQHRAGVTALDGNELGP